MTDYTDIAAPVKQVSLSYAEALIAGVPRYDASAVMWTLEDVEPKSTADGGWVRYSDVLAALSTALDPAIAERAGEVLERLQKADEYEPLGNDGWDAADLITALLTANAALRAERDASNELGRAFEEDAGQQRARAEAAEAKLAEVERELALATSGAQRQYNDMLSALTIAEAKLAEVTAERDDLAERNKENSRLAEENAAGLREAEATVAAQAAQIEAMRGALELIADTDPDEGTAWFHTVANAALTTEEGNG